MNKKVIWGGLAAAVTSAAVPLAVVSCGSSSANPWKDSKTIVVSVDGAQEGMWNEAIAQFNKTPFHTEKGFNIKTVKKDVWGALDVVTTVGYADENAGDLLYMPQDRMTSMLQQKALMPISAEKMNAFLDGIGASTDEKTKATAFGTATMRGKDLVFGIAHNKEGIVVGSTKPNNAATRAELDEGVLTLQNEAKGLFRLQDLWYGSALFAKQIEGKPGETAADYILHGDKSSWDSGFAKIADENAKDPVTEAFRTISDSMSDMWFEPLMKAYHPTLKQKIGPEWFANQIKPADLKNFFQNDMGAVNNNLMEWVSKGDLDYMYAGTWDSQILASKNIRNIYNPSHKLTSTSNSEDFIQASGTWSFGINARNNGASQDRIDAIFALLDAIYSKEAFSEYYKQDSKIPYYKDIQDDVKSTVSTGNREITAAAKALFDDAKFKENLTKYATDEGLTMPAADADEAEIIPFMSGWLAFYMGEINSLRDHKVDEEWHGVLTPVAQTFPSTYEAAMNPYANVSYVDVIGLKNMMTEVIGLPDNSAWEIPLTDLKEGLKDTALFNNVKQSGTSAHVRKLQEQLVGFNGDDGEAKTAFINKFKIDASGVNTVADLDQKITAAKAKFDAEVTNVQGKASKFHSDFAKSTVPFDKTKSDDAITKYLGNLWNDELRRAQFEFIENNIVATLKFELDDSKEITLTKVQKDIQEAAKTLTLNKVFEVITADGSATTTANGKFEAQDKRFDRINPQFGAVWGMWNDNVFGSKTFLKSSIDTAAEDAYKDHDAAETKFKELVRAQLQKLFTDKIDQLEAANATGVVNMD